MSPESRRLAGLLLVILPTVMIGGVSILTLLINDPDYMQNPLRQDLWRAGHAHAGVFLALSLIILRYVDEAELTTRLKGFVRLAIPSAAILLPAVFFLSVLRPDATEPNGLIALAYPGRPACGRCCRARRRACCASRRRQLSDTRRSLDVRGSAPATMGFRL